MYKYLVEHQFKRGNSLSSEPVADFNEYSDAEDWAMKNNALVQEGTLRVLEIPCDPTDMSLDDIYQWTNPKVLYEGYWVVR